MSVTVIDASAIAAVLFDEPEAAPVAASVSGSLLAPSLLRYEMASVCAVKLRREPRAARTTLLRYRLLSGLDIEFTEPDWEALPLLARQWDISAYDAAYLQLALKRGAALVTLDVRLAGAFDRASRH
jgi:predicted nucleic acid-binding protein